MKKSVRAAGTEAAAAHQELKSVGTKVSEEEFAELEARVRARELTLSEWVRAELLEPRADGGAADMGPPRTGLRSRGEDEVLLGEVLALRTILINCRPAFL